MATGEKEKIFGSVTAHDVSRELEVKGFSVDRRDIHFEAIKMLGQHKVTVNLGDGLSADLTIVVEKV